MHRILKASTSILLVLAIARVAGWTDGFHLAAGPVLIAVALTVIAAWRRKRRLNGDLPAREDEGLPSSPLRTFLVGGLQGAGLALYLCGTFMALQQIPWVYAGYYDRDRREVEEKVQILLEANNPAEAARLLAGRMRRPMSQEWRPKAAKRLYDCLIQSGKAKSNLSERMTIFTEAQRVAKKHGLDDQIATMLLANANRAKALEMKVQTLRAKKRYDELVNLLEVKMDEEPPSVSREWLAKSVLDAYLAWANACDDLPGKRARLVNAMSVASLYGLDAPPASMQLQLVDAEIERLKRQEEEQSRPVALPAGAQGGIAQVSTDAYPPVLIVHLWVEDAAGRPIVALKPKDFQILIGDQAPNSLEVSSIVVQPSPLHVALVVDTSGSMKGAALDAAKTGVTQFLAGVSEPAVSVEILSFSADVRRTCGWTTDFEMARLKVPPLTAGGPTALFQAIAAALDDLRGKSGDKRLVVFTDGKDTVGGANLNDILSEARRQRVVIHTIGLKTDELDSKALERLASESGGEYVEAASSDDIARLYKRTSRHIRRSQYRLVLTPPNAELPDGTEITITVGGVNAVQANRTVAFPPKSEPTPVAIRN